MKDFLSMEQVATLRQAHKTIRDKKLADRIKAILSLNAGFEYTHIARILLLDEITLRRYVDVFREKGVDGLLECRYAGGHSRLNPIQEQRLKRFLKENTQRTASEVTNYIRDAYQLNYSVIGVTKLLHRLGFVYKKPKVIPGKADRIKQEQFLKTYQTIKSQLKTEDQIYFLDSTHPTHNTKPSYGWILKGKQNDKFVKTNTGRERLNLNGALNLIHHNAVIMEEKTINSSATINLFKRLEKTHQKGKLYLILDNASHHHSKLATLWLKKHPRLKTVFLPSYSPNLNLIERLWRFFHQRVTWNHYFATYAEFRKTSLDFFDNLHVYQKELSTLLADNFQPVPT